MLAMMRGIGVKLTVTGQVSCTWHDEGQRDHGSTTRRTDTHRLQLARPNYKPRHPNSLPTPLDLDGNPILDCIWSKRPPHRGYSCRRGAEWGQGRGAQERPLTAASGSRISSQHLSNHLNIPKSDIPFYITFKSTSIIIKPRAECPRLRDEGIVWTLGKDFFYTSKYK